jgi:hypothetical protein
MVIEFDFSHNSALRSQVILRAGKGSFIKIFGSKYQVGLFSFQYHHMGFFSHGETPPAPRSPFSDRSQFYRAEGEERARPDTEISRNSLRYGDRDSSEWSSLTWRSALASFPFSPFLLSSPSDNHLFRAFLSIDPEIFHYRMRDLSHCPPWIVRPSEIITSLAINSAILRGP